MAVCDTLQAVYARWEARAPPHITSSVAQLPPTDTDPPKTNGYSNNLDELLRQGQARWRENFKQANRPPPSFPRSYKTKNRRYRRTELPQVDVDSRLMSLAFFKVKPTIYPVTDKYKRPFMGRCCQCMPHSRDKLYEESISTQGLQNILEVVTKRSENSWSTRTFHHISFVMARDVSHKYPDVSLAVLTSVRVSQAIQQSAINISDVDQLELLTKKQLKTHKKKANQLVKRIRATISNALIRFTGWFLHKLTGRLYSRILVHKGQIEMVRRATETKLPVIYLPTHRSHMDYILLTFILFNFDIQAPHVAAGDNLLIPFFGQLMRSLGGYFIRRKMCLKNGQKDILYCSILQTYMEELLKRGQSFEFFLEGGRSRSGKTLHPKGGLLSIIVESYLDGVIPDALLVPVSFSYERILDGHFNREQMGEPKLAESFWRAVRGIWSVIRAHYGSVRVDFGQPFSVKEYMEVSQGYGTGQDIRGSLELLPSTYKKLALSDSSSSLFGMEDHRESIQALAEHVVYNFTQIQAAMATQILAFILLNKHRQGARLSELEVSFDWMKLELVDHRRDVGFCGKTRDIVLYAAQVLGDHLVEVQYPPKTKTTRNDEDQNNNESDDIYLKPAVSLPHVFGLSYYANTISSVFAVDSILAVSICVEAGDGLWAKAGHDEPIQVSKNAIFQRAMDLCHILKYEFIFKPPCRTWMSVFDDSLEQLLISDVIQLVDTVVEERWTKRLSHAVSWDVDNDSEDEIDQDEFFVPADIQYNVNEEAHSLEKLRCLTSVVGPLLEAYHVVTCQSTLLRNQTMLDSDFIKKVQASLKERVHNGVADYAESSSMDTMKNALHMLRKTHVIDSVSEGKQKRLSFASSSLSDSRFEEILECLEATRICNMI